MLVAFVQGWPGESVTIRALGAAGPLSSASIADVRLLGRNEPLKFVQGESGLRVDLPAQKPATADIGIALRINFA